MKCERQNVSRKHETLTESRVLVWLVCMINVLVGPWGNWSLGLMSKRRRLRPSEKIARGCEYYPADGDSQPDIVFGLR